MNDEINIEDKIEVKEIIDIPEGIHAGEITKIERKIVGDQSYDYTDVYIQLEDIDVEMKTGFPTNISELSKLGMFLKIMGMKFEDEEYLSFKEIQKFLMGKKLQFQTFNSETGFARIIPETIKKI